MRIEVKIMNKGDEVWSLPIEIDEFITNPHEVEFEWEDGTTLPYNDFIFYGEDYYYGIFINDKKLYEFNNYVKELEEYKKMYEGLCK